MSGRAVGQSLFYSVAVAPLAVQFPILDIDCDGKAVGVGDEKQIAHLPCCTRLHVSEKAYFQRAVRYTNLQHVSRTALGFINEDS